jgi:hypothetical protein
MHRAKYSIGDFGYMIADEKRTEAYVAALQREINLLILDMTDGNKPLGEIAGARTESFPNHFTGRNDALGRVGTLSQQYSR